MQLQLPSSERSKPMTNFVKFPFIFHKNLCVYLFSFNKLTLPGNHLPQHPSFPASRQRGFVQTGIYFFSVRSWSLGTFLLRGRNLFARRDMACMWKLTSDLVVRMLTRLFPARKCRQLPTHPLLMHTGEERMMWRWGSALPAASPPQMFILLLLSTYDI